MPHPDRRPSPSRRCRSRTIPLGMARSAGLWVARSITGRRIGRICAPARRGQTRRRRRRARAQVPWRSLRGRASRSATSGRQYASQRVCFSAFTSSRHRRPGGAGGGHMDAARRHVVAAAAEGADEGEQHNRADEPYCLPGRRAVNFTKRERQILRFANNPAALAYRKLHKTVDSHFLAGRQARRQLLEQGADKNPCRAARQTHLIEHSLRGVGARHDHHRQSSLSRPITIRRPGQGSNPHCSPRRVPATAPGACVRFMRRFSEGDSETGATVTFSPNLSQNRVLRVTKKVRPQPAARGPSVAEGFAVLVESFASVTLYTPAVTRVLSSPSGAFQSRVRSWPIQDSNRPSPRRFSISSR